MPVLNYLTRIQFDHGALDQLGKELSRNTCERPLIVTDAGLREVGLLDVLLSALPEGLPQVVYDETPGNPTEVAVLTALELYHEEGCDSVIGLGGGSAMDLGKAVALLAVNEGPLERFDPLQGGARLIRDTAPLIAIPTTAGTGSEVSVGTVIILEDGRKATFASNKLVPKAAICDPDLTLGLPPLLTAATGMDAVTHCIEAVLSPVVNPPADGIGLDGLHRAWRALPRAVEDGTDKEARWHMMMAATEGALAFVKGLGGVHSMSHAAGRLSDLRLHHGTLNAVILPTILRFNRPGSEAQYERLATAMGLASGEELPEAVAEMNRTLGLPSRLGEMGIEASMIEDLAHHAEIDLATRTNPRAIDRHQFAELFEQAL